MHVHIYIYIYIFLGIRFLGATFWRGLSDHLAATAQKQSGGKAHRRVPTTLRSISQGGMARD